MGLFAIVILGAISSLADAKTTCQMIENTSVSLAQKPYRLPGVETWHHPIYKLQQEAFCKRTGGCIVAEDPQKAKANLNHGRVILWGNPKSGKPSVTDLTTAPNDNCMNGSFYPDICADTCRTISMPKNSNYKPGQVLFIPGLKGKMCAGKEHDGCVVVAEALNRARKAGTLFVGRCLSTDRNIGLCRDKDVYASERSVNSVGPTNVWLAPDELANKFKQELADERKSLVAKMYQQPMSAPAPVPTPETAAPTSK